MSLSSFLDSSKSVSMCVSVLDTRTLAFKEGMLIVTEEEEEEVTSAPRIPLEVRQLG
jgi:hypothetical protein